MPSITLVAHNIRSTHNVGAIFRTADGFGVTKIILSGYTPYPKLPDCLDTRLPHESNKVSQQIHKTALGAEALVPFEYFADLTDWTTSNQLPLIALEQSEESVSIRDFTPPKEFALILGEEVNGIEQSLLARCQATVEIPMSGQKESFNVSVAAGIALYALT